MNAARHRALAAELALDEIVVVEVLLRQVQPICARRLRPAGLLIRPAFGAGPGLGRDFRAAVGASLGGMRSSHARVFLVHLQVQAHQDVIVGMACMSFT